MMRQRKSGSGKGQQGKVISFRRYSKNKTLYSLNNKNDKSESRDSNDRRERKGWSGMGYRKLTDPYARASRSKKIIYALIGVVFVVVFLYSSILDGSPDVSYVGTDIFRSSKAQYEQYVRDTFASSLLRRNKLTIDRRAIEKLITDEFPEVREVLVVVPLVGKTPKVIIAFSEPTIILESLIQQPSIVNNSGVVIAKGAEEYLPKNKVLPRVVDSNSLPHDVGTQALRQEMVNFVRVFFEKSKAESLVVDRFVLSDDEYSLDIYYEDLPYYLKVDTSTDIEQQFGGFMAFKHKIEKQEKATPSHYIDVRAEGKLFYK